MTKRYPNEFVWNDETVHRLMALRGRGLSASAIGKDLGVSRNAVIDKLNRLGFSMPAPVRRGRANRVPDARKARPQPTLAQVEVPEPAVSAGETEPGYEPVIELPEPPEAVPATGTAAAVMGLRPRSCRWPVGDPKHPGFTFCGAVRTRGAYCATHASVAYATVKEAS